MSNRHAPFVVICGSWGLERVTFISQRAKPASRFWCVCVWSGLLPIDPNLVCCCLFDLADSPPTRTAQAASSSVFFGGQDPSRDCSFLKPLASTPGNSKTLPISEHALKLHVFYLFHFLSPSVVWRGQDDSLSQCKRDRDKNISLHNIPYIYNLVDAVDVYPRRLEGTHHELDSQCLSASQCIVQLHLSICALAWRLSAQTFSRGLGSCGHDKSSPQWGPDRGGPLDRHSARRCLATSLFTQVSIWQTEPKIRRCRD